MKIKIISIIIVLLTAASAVLTSCETINDNTTAVTDTTATESRADTTAETETDTETETSAETGTDTEEITVDEDPVHYKKIDRDPVDPASASLESTDWISSIQYANEVKNGVQGRFTDAKRRNFLIENRNFSLIYDLKTAKNKLVTGFYNAYGKAYFENCMDTTVTDQKGTVYSAARSIVDVRMNSHRMGYYYCDFRFCDQILVSTASNGSKAPFLLEHIFHTYSEKMYEVVRIVATGDYKSGGRLETSVVIAADTVRKVILKNENGEVSDLDGFDFSTVEYVGFDVIGVGIWGVIMPVLENNGDLKVELKDNNYVITSGIDLNGEIKNGEDVYFGHRIYSTASHQFNDLRKEAYIERNPLTDVYLMSDEDDAQYLGYDALIGCYRFTCKKSSFNYSYKTAPDKHYKVNAFFSGDGVVDRTVYIQTAEGKNSNGMLPMPLEVGKNFSGEYEEPTYDPQDKGYGEVYVPITVGKDENKRFTMLHLYQNWGKSPLKQLSFIAYTVPYYHLSVGVTETNCIAPYFVMGKDGWTLPDFRSNSAPFFPETPQHQSAGRLYFLQYKDANGKSNQSESQTADISSAGPVYADIKMDYLSDDGKIKAEYRHVEMAHTDENRTYYDIKLTVLEDVSFKDFRNDFSFFTFDGRGAAYSKVVYLDESGNSVTEDAVKGTRIIKLGSEYPYYGYFSGNTYYSVNFALIVLGSDITVNGEKYEGGFVFRDDYDGTLNTGSLTLDLESATLKKGDVLEMRIILMPWGFSTSTDDKNVLDVRQDSGFDPYKLTVITGSAADDAFIPSIKAENGTAVFRLSGGANRCAVRVYGFEKYEKPTITYKSGGNDTEMILCSENGYDGYQVYYDKDGTYSFTFNVDMDAADEYEITVKQ